MTQCITYRCMITRLPPSAPLSPPLSPQMQANWSAITSKIGSSVQIVGDDLLVTNPKRIAGECPRHS